MATAATGAMAGRGQRKGLAGSSSGALPNSLSFSLDLPWTSTKEEKTRDWSGFFSFL